MRSDPYRGLMPYQEEDAAYFFGRNRERKVIASNLSASRFTLLYGPSGVGKTSVLRAGVLRDMRTEARANLDRLGLPEFAVAWLSEWRGDPSIRLERAVRDAVADAMGGDGGPVNGDTTIDRLAAWCERLNGELFLVLDQFEEYFLYHPNDIPGDFADTLARIASAKDLPVNLLVSLRDDALSQMDRFKGRIPKLFSNYLRIDRLDFEAGRLAIDGPVERWNENREDDQDPEVTVEPELREEVLRQVQLGQQGFGHRGRGVAKDNGQTREEIETPYLQLVMQRIWSEEREAGSNALRLQTLKDLGGAQEILRTHLGRVLNRLAPAEQDIARKVFYYLVTPSGAKIAHSAEDLANYTECETAEIEEVLKRLCQRESRILREVVAADDTMGNRFEIYHDVLGSAILEWQRNLIHQAETAELIAAKAAAERHHSIMRAATRFNLWLACAGLVLLGIFYGTRIALLNGARDDLTFQLDELQAYAIDTQIQAVVRLQRTDYAVQDTETAQEQQQDPLTRLTDALSAEINDGSVTLQTDGDFVVITLSASDLFNSGAVKVNENYGPVIEKLAGVLNAVPGPIGIVGHTDSVPLRGIRRDNTQLSLDRAQSVLDAMKGNIQDSSRLFAEGRGDLEAIAQNETPEGRARNRRIEIIVRKES